MFNMTFENLEIKAIEQRNKIDFNKIDKFGIQRLVKKAFDQYDTDKSGLLEKDEMKNL